MRCRGSDSPRTVMKSRRSLTETSAELNAISNLDDTLAMIGFGLLILVAPTSIPGLTPPVSM